MPFKNAEKWIAETIDSILDQSFTDWQLICVDDGSADGSVNVVKSIAENDPRIEVYTNSGKGIISALQLGLSLATNEFITRMDADDLMPPNRLQTMVNKMVSLPTKSIVTGKVKYFSESVVSPGYLRYENWLNTLCDEHNHYNHIFRECIVASPNWMCRKEDLLAVRIFEQLTYPEDYSMCFLWFQHGFQIHALDEVTLMWREHPERTSRNSDVYAQASFFNLKVNWFCRLHKVDKIGLLGAGTKGKLAANALKSNHQKFQWYDYQFEQFNTLIMGQEIMNYHELNEEKILIAIYPEPLDELIEFLRQKNYVIGKNAWFL